MIKNLTINLNTKKDLIFFILLSRWPHKLFIVFLALVATFAALLVPFFQKNFVETLSLTDLSLAAGFAFVSFTCFQLTNFFGNNEALICQSELSSFLYSHILKLKTENANKTVGEKVALYTTDVPSSTMWLEQSLPYVLTTFFPLLITPFFLDYFYKVPFYYSMSVIGILLIFNWLMAYRQSIFFYRFKILAGERMGLVNEWIQNIKSLRTLGWTTAFENKIIQKRQQETKNRISMVTNGQIMNSFSASITFWLNLFVLVFILLTVPVGSDPNAAVHKSDMLVLLWVLGIFLSRPLRQLPWLLTMLFDALTSVNRLDDFLKIKNQDNQIRSKTQQKKSSVLEMVNLNLSIDQVKILKSIDIDIFENEIVALIGPVGSGKTLLLKSIIDESAVEADQLYADTTSYLPQDSFILSATIKDNMTLTYDSNESEDDCLQALASAEFDIEADRLPDRLKTVIGERGLNLSGGQKQRLNLSRIFFNPQKLILLDDPFSAVDVGTEQKLIQSIEKLKTKNHSFLVTTQRYTFLDHCDRILFLEDGQIKFNGTFQDFKSIKKYRDFLQ